MAMKGGGINDESSSEQYSEDEEGSECEYSPEYTISLDNINTDDNPDHIFRCHNNLTITNGKKQVTPEPTPEDLKKVVNNFIKNFKNLTSLRVDGLGNYFTLDMLNDLPNKEKMETIFMKDTTAAEEFKNINDDKAKAELLNRYGLTELEYVKYGKGKQCNEEGVWIRDCFGENNY